MKYSQDKIEDSTVFFSCSENIENSNDFRFLDEFIDQKMNAILDLSEVEYINSCGFGAMVEETMNYADGGVTLSFTKLPAGIRKTLGVLGGEELLNYLD